MLLAMVTLIALILLFGAGVVKGWLANIFGWLLGLTILAGLILLVVSQFGATGFMWLIVGGGGLLLVGSLWARLPPPSLKPIPTPGQPPTGSFDADESADRVWGWYEDQIENHFCEADRARAVELHRMADVRALDLHCREAAARSNGRETLADFGG